MNIIHHIAFNCNDINKMENFYSAYFGFKRARVFEKGTGKEFILLKSGNSYIELFPLTDSTDEICESSKGFKHLAFQVDSIEDFIKNLKSAGIKTDDILDYSHISPGFKICFFDDPEGNRIEVMEGYKDEYF